MKGSTLVKILLLLAVVGIALYYILYLSNKNVSKIEQVVKCNVSEVWLNDPRAPNDVAHAPGENTSEFCQFYQFSWQWFLYLITPSSTNGEVARFQDQKEYPLLEASGENSCDMTAPEHAFHIRTAKSMDDRSEATLPERTDQAGAEAIYDQNGNVVFYEIRFSRSMCDYNTIITKPNFPGDGKTVEMKTAWKIITESDKPQYFWTDSSIKADSGTTDELLGLVGFHIAIATEKHPEFIWVSFEHKLNSASCYPDQNETGKNWSFTSDTCAARSNECTATFNQSTNFTTINDINKITEICRITPYGTSLNDTGNSNARLNIELIEKLNEQVLGEHGIVSKSGQGQNIQVWKNYFMLGALWESNITKPSSDLGNQRGSLQLANSVMETTFQSEENGLNCFNCHNYYVDKSNTVQSEASTFSGISHIFDDIATGCKANNNEGCSSQ